MKKSLFKIQSSLILTALIVLLSGCPVFSRGEMKIRTGDVKGNVTCSEAGNNGGINVFLESTDGLRSISTARSLSSQFRSASGDETFFVTKTDSDGNYVITDVPVGLYTLYAATQDSTQKVVTTNVNVVAGNITTVKDLLLTGTGKISGKVLIDGTENGNLGVTVFIPRTSYSATTADDGSFIISDVPEGTYALAVQKDFCTKIWKTEPIAVKTGETTDAGSFKSITSAEITKDYKDGLNGKDGNDGKDGISIIWLGYFEDSSEITVPEIMNAYFNTKDGCSYIYDGTEWVLLAQAGKVKDQFLNVYQNSDGILFCGALPITSSSFYVEICEMESGICMSKYYADNNGISYDWLMVYPLVNPGKEYTFRIYIYSLDWVYEDRTVTIIPENGLGEFVITNKDGYQLELTEDKVLRNTKAPVFTENPNVSLQSVYRRYYLYKQVDGNQSGYEDYWEGEIPVYASIENNELPLKDLSYYFWKTYETLDADLRGFDYSFYTKTFVKINGFSSDGIEFYMADKKKLQGSWGGNKVKKVMLYAVDFEIDGISYSPVSIDEAEEYAVIENMPGELKTVIANGFTKKFYVEDISGIDRISEPKAVPEVTQIFYEEYSAFKGIFTGWTLPVDYTYTLVIDGEEYTGSYRCAKFELDYKYTVDFKLTESDSDVYCSKNIDSKNKSYYSSRSVDYFTLPEAPEKPGKVFLYWYVKTADSEGTPVETEITNDFISNKGIRSIAVDNDCKVNVYAKYTDVHTVTYMDGTTEAGTGYACDSKILERKSLRVKIMEDNTKLFFHGWYTDPELTVEWNYLASEDITVYAHFSDISLCDTTSAGSDISRYEIAESEEGSVSFEYYFESGKQYKIECVDSFSRNSLLTNLTDCRFVLKSRNGTQVLSSDADASFHVDTDDYYYLYVSNWNSSTARVKGAFHFYMLPN